MCWVFRKSHPRKFLNHFWNCIAVPGSVQPSRWLLNVQAFVFDGSTLARYPTCGRARANLAAMGVPLHSLDRAAFHGVEDVIVDFVLSLLGRRALSGVQYSDSYPNRLYLALARDPVRHIAQFKSDWQILLRAESLAPRSQGMAMLVNLLRWNTSVLPRLLFLFMERSEWNHEDPDVHYLLSGVFNRIGDTLVIENMHKELRRLGKHSQNEIISRTKRQFHVVKAKVLETRSIPTVRITNAEVARASSRGRKTAKRIYDTRSAKLPKEFSKIMLPRKWTSPSPSHLPNAVGAWQWLRAFLGGGDYVGRAVDSAWWSRLVPERSILRMSVVGPPRIVIATTDWGALTMPMDTKFICDDGTALVAKGIAMNIDEMTAVTNIDEMTRRTLTI